MTDFLDEKEFEERSDYIEDNNLELWNVHNQHFDFIQKKLLGVGAKLLVGPRGTGKTHQMKIAHLLCNKDNSKPLSIFVSFTKYYHLEPFLTKVPNALQVFHTWVLSKIILSCYALIEERKDDYSLFANSPRSLSKEAVTTFVEKAEKLRASQLSNDSLIVDLTIHKVIDCLEQLCNHYKRKRVVLMLDDAALSLTPEYLVEFFDIVRSLKTKGISPKASVYPGTTQYGPRFHVGQDAEMVPCWLGVENSTYSSFMDSLVEQRFVQYKSGISTEIIELFKYASFGVPRAFISLLRNYKGNPDKSTLAKFNAAIDQQAKFIETEYLSIEKKLVQYRKVIETGNSLFKNIIECIKEENKTSGEYKNIVIGIQSESIDSIKLASRMVRFLIEAGLLYEEVPVKHGVQEKGEKREYKRYIPHILFLIQNRTFSQGHGTSFSETLNNIKKKSKKHPVRRVLNTLLDKEELDGLTLDLPPCQSCNTPRLTVEQRFCHNCGKELVNQSAFEKCLKISVDALPLTDWQKVKVKEIGLNVIGDFLALQDPAATLRKIPRIGEVKSTKIYSEVVKTVDEFLA
ncbi:hypothetical protein [Chitinophaga sp. MM2321]|uniref:hypothetical protein n=1 Tax=Chitinophaga sp. MM2321 TaxID=3137178 RepID=UPI0032D58B73